jgi:hypothetical protein
MRRAGVVNKVKVSELAAVKTQQTIKSEDEHQVLEFRPRASTRLGQRKDFAKFQPRERPEPNDLSRYEQEREEPDDFRHRMLANLAAIAFTIALIAVGLWLAKNIAEFRNTQDCILMGRRDCARIATPHI